MEKVKSQVDNPVLDRTNWVVGIDIGQKKISCAFIKKDLSVLY